MDNKRRKELCDRLKDAEIQLEKKKELVRYCREQLQIFDTAQDYKILTDHHITPGGLNMMLAKMKEDGSLKVSKEGATYKNERVDN